MPRIVASELTSREFNSLRTPVGSSSVTEDSTRIRATSDHGDRPVIKISCVDVSLEVGAKKNRKKALVNVNASFGAAKLTALMGPSGAGKTTLLNVLTGIGKCDGEILFNDAPRPKDFVAMCAVIPQEDTLYGALTPRETFTYVARLRLGDDVPLAHKIAAAEEMIVRLELTKCADTPVGNEDIRGISGGEKKRTSIGCELIVNPVVLFVDEPTSGLDSKMARSVVEHLQHLARAEHRTVITVIHQPSWRIFSLFDALVLLKDGRVVYDGPAVKVKEYFENIGFSAPLNENPMDFFFDVLQECDPTSPTSKLRHADPLFFHDQWQARGLLAKGDSTVSTGSAKDVEMAAQAASDAATRTSILQQFIVLTERCCYDYVRDKTKLMGGIGLKFGVGAVFGVIWLNQGRGKHTQGKIYTVEGPIFFCCFSAVFDTMFGLIIKYPLTRALIQREYRNRYYSIGPYFFAELLSRSVFECFNALFLGVPCFFLVGLALSAQQFFIFLSVLCMLSVIGASIGIVVGTKCKDIQEAQGAIMPVLMPLMLFSGFFIPYDEIPVFFKWLYDLSFLRYGFNILKINQWKGMNFDDCDEGTSTDVCPVTCYVDGDDYLDQTGANELSMGTDFLIVFGFVVGITLYSFVSMRSAVMNKARQG